jgi:SAM-dependent methyltransferase
MKDLKWQIYWYKAHTLEAKKSWYDEVAIAYDRTRPRYLQQQCDRIIELTNLPSNATILELGCGPGMATVDYAALGYSMVCLEPSKEACKLARKNCQNYPNVNIINSTFEEWELTSQKFDAVLAATSFHWIAPEIRYIKTASILKDNGWLILLWNTPPQLKYEAYKLLEPIYQKYAPNIMYETLDNYQKNLDLIATEAINSGYFNNLLSQGEIVEVTYTIDDYLSLLGTLSPYIALKTQIRNFLFTDLKEVLENNFASMLPLSYLSIWHIAQKV